jgi:hypothetical protein
MTSASSRAPAGAASVERSSVGAGIPSRITRSSAPAPPARRVSVRASTSRRGGYAEDDDEETEPDDPDEPDELEEDVVSWSKLDDNFPDHPKVVRLGVLRPLAGWLFVCGLAYCARYLTDGFIPRERLPLLMSVEHLSVATGGVRGLASVGEDVTVEMLAARLVEVGLWHHRDDGFQVHDYLEYNPSRQKVLDERKRKRSNVQAFRQRQRNPVTDPVTGPVTGGFPSPAARPVPSRSEESKAGQGVAPAGTPGPRLA